MTRLSPFHLQFQQHLRDTLRSHLPEDIRSRVQNERYLHKEDFIRWNKILYKLGFFAKSWPKEYGGPGWDIVQQYLFEQENALAGAPWIIPYGIGMVGPVLIRFGTDEQRRRHLPGILTSETWWCQGYSEPNAGSDLASLKCRAVLKGDSYIINGTKMWTTLAHYADMMHALVRTGDGTRKQEGISFLLIDMQAAGITIHPIISIDGVHHTNQVFFDNVAVPLENRVGSEGQGWTIAKFLLSHERTASAETGWKLRWLKLIEGRLQRLAEQEGARELLPTYSRRLAELKTEVLTLAQLERMLVMRWHEGGAPAAHEAAALKVRATEIEQALAKLGMDVRGPYRTAFEIPAILGQQALDEANPWEAASCSLHQYLRTRAASIYAGSNEIQRGIISQSILK